jgi:DNA-binding CsgD family transcriptional regulator
MAVPLPGIRRGGSGQRDTPLSARETQVLRQLALGLSPTEIAAQLGISGDTARNHLRNARAKLGAKTRVHAVALALERGLIEL